METFADDPKPTVVQTRGGPVACVVTGEGPVVLALHGGMGGYDQGLLLLRTAVGSGFRFVSISRPGYPGTPLVAGRTSAQQADLCADVLDAMGIGAAAVVAVSSGGPCALEFALRHRERCWGLVLISACSMPLTMRPPLTFFLMQLIARWPALAEALRREAAKDPERTVRRSIPDAAARARVLQDPEAGPLLLALYLSTMDRPALRLPGTRNDIAQMRTASPVPLEQIAVPTLAVHGTSDHVVPFTHAQAVADRVPGAALLAIDGGTHVCVFTHRAEIKQRAAGFLGLHAPVGAASEAVH